MRTFHYNQKNDDPTGKAHEIVADIEQSLGTGVRLQVDDPEAPNDVHGYVNTYFTEDGVGHVEVHLYDPIDVAKIERLPDLAVRHRNIQKVHSIGDTEVHSKMAVALGKKGYKRHVAHSV